MNNNYTGAKEQKSKRAQALMLIIRDRTLLTFLVSAVLIILMGTLRPDKPEGMYPTRYWATKITWENCADMVIAGDSRSLMAVSPEELEKVFPGTEILNYAFGANWYSEKYLQALEELLYPNSKNKRIFVGISPHALTHRTNSGHFLEMTKRSKQNIYIERQFAAILEFFEPMSFRDAFYGLFPNLAPTRTRKYFYPDGFVAVHKNPLELNELKRYRKLFEKRQVSEIVIKNITDFTSKWTNEGIIVYGFLVPSCKEMAEMEKNISGFNEEKFKTVFKQAGGIWIDFDQTAYSSFDGSHLQDEGAYRFSKDLAKSVKEIENRFTKRFAD